MKNNEIKERLVAVYDALNNIEVKGVGNVSNLAGCLQIIQETIKAIRVEVESASA